MTDMAAPVRNAAANPSGYANACERVNNVSSMPVDIIFVLDEARFAFCIALGEEKALIFCKSASISRRVHLIFCFFMLS